eukprot:TRINITY_DN16981_c1_g1_i1.p1 TRINITY_DN16981_c1_g1~~TRINITY_DN16981_c1_g1_i1.p1  ORF type:complete len:524 (+),score=120.66 TRINITY_DN16981_c1_g1_i1:74-1573(+)
MQRHGSATPESPIRVVAGSVARFPDPGRQFRRTASGGEPRACRICYEESEGEFELFAPCHCTGTMRWVHPRCLDLSRRTAADASKCPCCGASYRLAFTGPGGAPLAWVSAVLNEAGRWAFAVGSYAVAAASSVGADLFVLRRLLEAPLRALQRLRSPPRVVLATLALARELDIADPANWATLLGRCREKGVREGFLLAAVAYNGAASCVSGAAGMCAAWAAHCALERLFGMTDRANRPLAPDFGEHAPRDSVELFVRSQVYHLGACYFHPGAISSLLQSLADPRVRLFVAQSVVVSWEEGRQRVAAACEREWALFGPGPRALRASRVLQRALAVSGEVATQLLAWATTLGVLTVQPVAADFVEEYITGQPATEDNEEAVAALTAHGAATKVGAAACGSVAFYHAARVVHWCLGAWAVRLPLGGIVFGGSLQRRVLQDVWYVVRVIVLAKASVLAAPALRQAPANVDDLFAELHQSAMRVRNEVHCSRLPIGVFPSAASA